MSHTLFFPRLSNTFHFSCNSGQIGKPILSSHPPTANLTPPSTQFSTINDENNIRSSSGIEPKNEELSLSSSKPSTSKPCSVIKAPTAPWMQGPLLVEPNQFLNLSDRPRSKKGSNFGRIEDHHPDQALTGKMGAGRGKKEMKKIFKGIKKLQDSKSLEKTHKKPEMVKFIFSPGELSRGGDSTSVEGFISEREDEKMHAQKIVEESEVGFQLGKVEGEGKAKFGGKMPWDRGEKLVTWKVKKEKVVTAAELSLDEELLDRLRDEASRMRKWVKVMKAGVTQEVVHRVHAIWKNNELAMLKFDLPLCRNMDRAQEILEMKTGGVVVWRKQHALVIYRGGNYLSALKTSFDNCCRDTIIASEVNSSEHGLVGMMSEMDKKEENVLMNGSLYEKEADRLLDGLGPRFLDWWWRKPLPVDGDLLPEVVPGFMPPFRLCPPHARSQLTDDELTYLRKLARPLPTHFVLGRNRKLHGLAAAILKLWEKCHIAKIAIKWGVPNTDNKQMAYELKLKKKIEKSAKRLADLNSLRRPAEQDTDQEMLTQEERECLRKMGLKMVSSLVLGRRGVFNGVIESLHQYWKHREIVKVITMQKMFSQVVYTAKFLEAESGGILVSVDKLKEGHSIILYRGKNYRRPKLAPLNLPSRREALSRSLEIQRIGSLKFFARRREQAVSDLQFKLAKLMQRKIDLMGISETGKDETAAPQENISVLPSLLRSHVL
ncbi:chloroplastic group IIA intron splicing facilitator CRS1, chloroplastic isoform X3 [Coffea eugenioides]|uniref:chloroplastic group IIA intron splicing facilitator CRS1, chloroplastic isoform X3 n=1 Tax=Coffea eugenioides TaxID=49369 RepID=UPI000F60E50E|nr:chloroplastic group IIA intron splicing facilitator CRS1, chloroplastic isoform X3 [Coffea eugenioides]